MHQLISGTSCSGGAVLYLIFMMKIKYQTLYISDFYFWSTDNSLYCHCPCCRHRNALTGRTQSACSKYRKCILNLLLRNGGHISQRRLCAAYTKWVNANEKVFHCTQSSCAYCKLEGCRCNFLVLFPTAFAWPPQWKQRHRWGDADRTGKEFVLLLGWSQILNMDFFGLFV